jgi:hypothetical protein
MMLVYRVEKNGVGPYWSDEVSEDLYERISSHNGCANRPVPRRDGIDIPQHMAKEYYFGFQDIESLKKWFRGVRNKLRKNGFKMSVYDVDENLVYIGKKQLAFLRYLAIPVEEKEIP